MTAIKFKVTLSEVQFAKDFKIYIPINCKSLPLFKPLREAILHARKLKKSNNGRKTMTRISFNSLYIITYHSK